VIRDLRTLGRQARPVSVNLDRLTRSLQRNGANEKLMDFLFFSATSVNGFDELGHYLRANLQANLCVTYSIEPTAGCPAAFSGGSSAAGASPDDAGAPEARLAPAPRDAGGGDAGVPEPPPLARLEDFAQRERKLRDLRRQAERPSPALEKIESPELEYLLGDDR
jgi:hypothetical protein